jgi:hypothetical protein
MIGPVRYQRRGVQDQCQDRTIHGPVGSSSLYDARNLGSFFSDFSRLAEAPQGREAAAAPSAGFASVSTHRPGLHEVYRNAIRTKFARQLAGERGKRSRTSRYAGERDPLPETRSDRDDTPPAERCGMAAFANSTGARTLPFATTSFLMPLNG